MASAQLLSTWAPGDTNEHGPQIVFTVVEMPSDRGNLTEGYGDMQGSGFRGLHS